MFAYLYLARVLNIFCCTLGRMTNKPLVTHFFHEKKFIFSHRLVGGKLYRATNSATGCLLRQNRTRSPQLLHSMATSKLWLVLKDFDTLFWQTQLKSFSVNPWCQIFVFGHTWLMGCHLTWQCTASNACFSLFVVWCVYAFRLYSIFYFLYFATSALHLFIQQWGLLGFVVFAEWVWLFCSFSSLSRVARVAANQVSVTGLVILKTFYLLSSSGHLVFITWLVASLAVKNTEVDMCFSLEDTILMINNILRNWQTDRQAVYLIPFGIK